MKTFTSLLSSALLLCGLLPARAAEAAAFARINSIRVEKTNVVVEVEASAELGKVTLESSTRVGRRAWEPRAVKMLERQESGTVNFTFTVPVSPAIEILRVRGDFADELLPASLYGGTNKFVAATGASAGTTGAANELMPGAADRVSAPPTGGDARTVVESDIWKVDGDTLYFFNQNRGLQVIDISNPDKPVLTGTYDLAAAGEQMYLLEHDKIALLARDNCSGYGNSQGSSVILLQVRNGVPELVNELAISGHIAESRLVGTALYVVANSYEQREVPSKDGAATSTEWEWGSRVSSFDLRDFSAAQTKSKDWVSGYGNVIYATDKYLFVAQSIWDPRTSTQNSVLNSYDISAPDGTFSKLATFNVPGTVRDKFKMQVDGDVFSVVLQIDSRQPRATYLQTYSLTNPAKPQRLAELKIVENEQLFATRFDGSRLYVVTFFVIDPLWIIDLTDPAAPKKVGELQIPGWSTFLQPMGDRLLAIGLDRTNGTQRTAVQLFDVADPANASLLSKVLIGDQWSDSEANWDEKAFSVLPEDHLALVPFWSSSKDGFIQGVQLIDLNDSSLAKRGVIEQDLGSRRATLHRDRILSLSSRELLTVDAEDRDNPKVVNSLELSWEADQVHLVGDYVIEVDANGSSSPALRVVSAEDTSSALQNVPLKELPYMGSTVLNGKLLVLQGRARQLIYPEVYNPTNYFPISTNPAVLMLSEFDLSALPELKLLRSTSKEGSDFDFFGTYEPLLLNSGVLVWRSKSSGYFPWNFMRLDVARAASADLRFAPGGIVFRFGGAAGHFIAVNPGALTFTSEVALSTGGSWWNFGEAFTHDGKIYTSHQASELDETIDPPPYKSSCYNEKTGAWEECTIDPPPGVWVQRYYLDVIDFADPAEPLVRKPVNLPGTLIGLARNAELLYTRGYNINPFEPGSSDEVLSASSFDGVEAHLITSMPFSPNWPRPALGNGDYLYVGLTPATGDASAVQVWTLNSSAQFELVHSVPLPAPAQQLELIRDMLVVQSSDLLLMDARVPAEPKLIGRSRSNGCYGVLLDAADGDITRGLWVPMGWNGVLKIPLGTAGQ